MKVHWLQHVEFEGLGFISQWLAENGHGVSCTRLFLNEPLPQSDDFDMLIIMGGPMNIHDYQHFPWLIEEKKIISESVARDKPVLGICLGAQLLAAALGAEILPNADKEIGWFEIVRSDFIPSSLDGVLPERLTVFHWHGDTFSLPVSGHLLYSSSGCRNQAFIYGNRQVGLQFHLEMGDSQIESLVENCRHELQEDGPWIEEQDSLLAGRAGELQRKKLLFAILDIISSQKHW